MYRALLLFIDCPRDSNIDWNIENAWAAGEGIMHYECWSQYYHDNVLYVGNYYSYFIGGINSF